MSEFEMQQFLALRRRLFVAIGKCLKECGHSKHYEGAFTVSQRFPNFFEAEQGETEPCWLLKLDCYVLGPSRHYEWDGKTFVDCLAAADKDISKWIAEWERDE